jgi:multidrug efflux system membrane fusion protein
VETKRSVTGRSHFRGIVAFAALTIAGGMAYWYWQPVAQPSGSPRAATRALVPVTIGLATRQDVPVYLTGLGAVQAWSTVRIHSQVDGKLDEVLFTEGQRVRKGDVLARIDPRLYDAALDQARAKKAQDEAQLTGAEKDLVRARTLAEKNVGSQQILDQQQAKVEQLKATIAADIAAIATAQTQLDYTSITAPTDGRIGMRLVDAGNLIRTSETTQVIATLMQTRPTAVIVTLPARYLDGLRAAQARGPVEVTAYDQDSRQLLSRGTLLLIDNAIDQTTATMRLKAVFPNEDERLWPGQFVNGRVLVETREKAIAVPAIAVQRGPQGLFVWIVTADDVAQARPVQVGPTSGDLTIVNAGLAEGDRVVVDGQYKLQVGAPVTITNRAPPPGGAE